MCLKKSEYMSFVKRLLWIVLPVVLMASCRSYEKVAYMRESGTSVAGDSTVNYTTPDPLIKVGDVLLITVNTSTPEASAAFNLPLIPSGNESTRGYTLDKGASLAMGYGMQNYLVESDGYLAFPVIGKLKVAGLHKSELVELIKSKIYPEYIKEEPMVLVRYANFMVSVLGEVSKPGQYPINNEKATLLEALAIAGDMTIYGERSNLLLVRETNGVKEMVRIDLRDKFLVHSPYFYLQQGDVIYVEPNGARSRSAGIGSAESLTISVVGTFISLATLVITLIN